MKQLALQRSAFKKRIKRWLLTRPPFIWATKHAERMYSAEWRSDPPRFSWEGKAPRYLVQYIGHRQRFDMSCMTYQLRIRSHSCRSSCPSQFRAILQIAWSRLQVKQYHLVHLTSWWTVYARSRQARYLAAFPLVQIHALCFQCYLTTASIHARLEFMLTNQPGKLMMYT